MKLWEKVIAEFGGYEKAKAVYEHGTVTGPLTLYNLGAFKAPLLEYRRANNIFEVGDKVTLNKWANDFSRSHNGIYEILSFENDLETLALLSRDIRSSTQHIKHATDEEIAIGHRL